MNQAELIKQISNNLDLLSEKGIKDVLRELGSIVAAQLTMGEEITLPGIGKFSVKQAAERKGRNPKTGESITIAARSKPHFSAAKVLKIAANCM